MQPGDVLLHNILVVHGSPRTTVNALRRVVYYEFRTAGVESRLGPHTPAYIPLKQAVLRGAINARQRHGFTLPGETPFTYDPPAPFNAGFGDDPPTYRYVHSDYWRKDG
jgi:ectoine hydroxylase-related dioxygenase (phytanoyl-CoA dioxygenase family)